MRKHLFVFLVAFFLIATFSQKPTYAAEKTSAPSAQLAAATSRDVEIDHRGEILKAYLTKYDSPLAEHADTFIEQADKYNLDWKMVAAISGVESGYGHNIPAYSYNGWGFGVYGTNVRRFASWDDGITTVSQALREEYMNARGATNVYEIGATYAADPSWAYKVQHFMSEIEAFAAEEEKANDALSISI